MYEDKKLVSAICASPIVLGEAEVIKGKYTCYPSCESSIKGGEYVEKDIVVCDGNVITSKGPATTVFFALELVKYLTGSNEELANDLLVNLKEEIFKRKESIDKVGIYGKVKLYIIMINCKLYMLFVRVIRGKVFK